MRCDRGYVPLIRLALQATFSPEARRKGHDRFHSPSLRPQVRCSLPPPLLVHADQRQSLAILRLEYPAFGGDVAFHTAVAVQMVR